MSRCAALGRLPIVKRAEVDEVVAVLENVDDKGRRRDSRSDAWSLTEVLVSMLSSFAAGAAYQIQPWGGAAPVVGLVLLIAGVIETGRRWGRRRGRVRHTLPRPDHWV